MGKWRVFVCIFAIATTSAIMAAEEWPQWGGPDRDFTLKARNLSHDWGEEGPPRIWSRPLGGGFSSIVGGGERLYATYRDGADELVVALEPDAGKTVWEHRYSAPIVKSQALSTQYGEGPNGTPLLVGGKLVTLGFTGQVHCLDAASGKLIWSHDLGKEFEAKIPYFGHATSPLAVGKNVVVVAGGLHAFDLASGKVVWQNREFEGSYGSPRLVKAGGGKQIVTPVSGNLAGFDVKTGKTLWSQELKNQWGTILTSPVLDDGGRVFISAAQVGSILVDPAAEKSESRQVWNNGATQINHSNAVRSGGMVFASAGGSASFISATSLEDGSQAWKQRGFAQANLLRVGNQYLLLDFDGELALVELDGEGMKIIARASISDDPTWTPPTLIGTILYVRDESRIQALDISAQRKR